MKRTPFKKIALLAGSFIVVTGGSIAANVPKIAEEFPTIPLQVVESLTTIPSLFLIFSVLFSHTIARWIGYKKTVLLGLGIVTVSGLIPVFVHNFWVIFLSRAFFGIGIGLFNSLLVSFIRYFYEGKERATMIGFQSAFEGIGGMTISFLVGQLLKISWQTSFWVYIAALPAFVLFALFVPDIPAEPSGFSGKRGADDARERDTEGKGKGKMRAGTFGYIALLFVVVMFYMSITVRVTPLMTTIGYGDATDGSNILSFIGIGAMAAGFLFGQIFTFIGKYTLPIAFLLLGLSLFAVGQSNSVLVTGLAAALCGFSFRTFIPYLFNKVNSSHTGNANLSTSLLLVGFNLGAALSPYGIALLEKLFRLASIRAIFTTEAAILLGFSAVSFGYHFFVGPRKAIE